MNIAIYPGSFDRITFGHMDIIERSSSICDRLIIGVLDNKGKSPLFSAEERVKMLQEVVNHIHKAEVVSFDGLLVDFVEYMNANIVVRGLRAVTDFEYELQMAQTNHIMNNKFETVFLTTSMEYSYLSSSVVRDIARFGGKIDKFVPEAVIDKVYDKYAAASVSSKNQ